MLLKNEDHILPLKKDQRVAVIGLLQKSRVGQGAGSSYINTPEVNGHYRRAGYAEHFIRFL